ncbi:DEAD/DEAH box helicase [Stakelama tenebrarum]|uniref:DEAD/DEAH box helicase n=1 Tax=Stakelama tenebrarum TaxID=2711215 RepID=A0A6G6Y2Y2_9SPHN|nr:DEAD/DEAH box helicase [Sphingosinithalassobacter tenebrarum]QIG79259.1 DEAD/DEAH box helicase [Sphingosinithalassobacter tenebrarum]
MTDFASLGLAETTLAALAAKGYSQATPIQAQAIPALLEGQDLLGIAQTGTGKTAAFMLPSIERLMASGKRPQPRGCRMLVLAPTRELAAQIAESAGGYAKGTPLKVATVFGGTSINKNRQDLARGVDILIATPGRLVDLMDNCHCVLASLEIFVLDEADQMMDLGFIHALRKIVRELPAKRQSLFFSATMPKTIRQLAGEFLRPDPVEVKVTPVATTAERVDQFVTFVNQKEKQALLTMKLSDLDIDRAIVFTRTKHGADRVVRQLAGNGIAANAIHGNKSQPQRERALGQFRSGDVKILVATDIAARGIDVSGVSHVFNFELPNVPEQYVHRIGRTARAGNDGVAISFCAPDEKPYLRDIERLTRQKVMADRLPDDFVARAEALRASAVPVKESRDQQNGRRGRDMQRDGKPEGNRRSRTGPGRPRRTGGIDGKRYDAQPAAEGARPQRGQGGRPQRTEEGRPARAEGNRDQPRGDRRPREDRAAQGESRRSEGPRRQDGERRRNGNPDGGRPQGQRNGAGRGGPRRGSGGGNRPQRNG